MTYHCKVLNVPKTQLNVDNKQVLWYLPETLAPE